MSEMESIKSIGNNITDFTTFIGWLFAAIEIEVPGSVEARLLPMTFSESWV